MTVLEKIKESGGFLDCGAAGSMPLGYFMDGTIMSTANYNEARRLVGDRTLKKAGSGTNEHFGAYLTHAVMKGEIYKAKENGTKSTLVSSFISKLPFVRS